MAPFSFHLLDTTSSIKPLTDSSSSQPGATSFIVETVLASLHGLAVAIYSCAPDARGSPPSLQNALCNVPSLECTARKSCATAW